MNRTDVQAWLDRYVEAWRTNERTAVEELFTDDAVYAYRPWESGDHTVRGREAIVANWLEEADAPGTWDAHYEPYVVEDDRAVAIGWSRYDPVGDAPERMYHNAFLLRFSPDGRCAEFHEYYMLEGT